MPGERLAVIGPNGAGKTTLFKLIAREERMTAGRVEFNGKDISRIPNYELARLGMGRTYQVTRIFPALTVQENVMLAAQGTRRGRFSMFAPARGNSSIRDPAREAIARVGLEKMAPITAAELGHGQQRQLELALALAMEPIVLLLDEPGAGLSASERGMMRELVASLPADITVLLIEHDMQLALGLADRCICMHNAKVIAEGTPEEIKADRKVQDIYLGKALE
ncbi:MAG: ATP-binding cassette domain-containing protein [Actinobacteria bacterium]|nr:ATP-binding cassette domain-containing protein [Actinomycetota bacterium]